MSFKYDHAIKTLHHSAGIVDLAKSAFISVVVTVTLRREIEGPRKNNII